MSNDHGQKPEVTQQPEGATPEASSNHAPRPGDLVEVASKDIPPMPLISHGSWGHHDLGEAASSLTLYNWGDPLYYQIEWDIPDLDEVEHIGCYFEWVSVGMEAKKQMTDYDGIQAMPDIAYQFLLEQGFIIPEEFKP